MFIISTQETTAFKCVILIGGMYIYEHQSPPPPQKKKDSWTVWKENKKLLLNSDIYFDNCLYLETQRTKDEERCETTDSSTHTDC